MRIQLFFSTDSSANLACLFLPLYGNIVRVTVAGNSSKHHVTEVLRVQLFAAFQRPWAGVSLKAKQPQNFVIA